MKDSKAHEDWLKSTTPKERRRIAREGRAGMRESDRLNKIIKDMGGLEDLWDFSDPEDPET